MEHSICIFGASSTQGFYDIEKGGWADRLKAYLYKKSLDTTDFYDLFNLGISGNTSRDMLKRFNNEAKVRNPTIIIISLGDNDSALGITVSEFESNMQEIIILAKKITKNVLLLGTKKVNEKLTNPVRWDKHICYNNKNIRKYDDKLNSLANKYDIKYLPLHNLLDDDDLEDGLHPNSKGHEKLFEKIKDSLIKFGFVSR